MGKLWSARKGLQEALEWVDAALATLPEPDITPGAFVLALQHAEHQADRAIALLETRRAR